jgi:hypothetical protein
MIMAVATLGEAIVMPDVEKSMTYYVSALPDRMDTVTGKLKFNKWQLEDWQFAWDNVKCCIVRSRGGSKTNDFTDWLVYRVLRTKEKWAWLSVKSGQLEQARSYLVLNPFVKEVKQLAPSKYDVYLINKCHFRLGIISTSNLGLRLDGIVFDEFEDCKEPSEIDAYSQMAGMLSTSTVHKQIYLGTLWIQTLFNDYCRTFPCKKRPWHTIKHLVDSGMIQQEINEKVTPQWQIDLLYNCIETCPSGVVFPNLQVETKATMLKHKSFEEQYGMDFGATDHCIGVDMGNGMTDVWALSEKEADIERFPSAFDDVRGKKCEAECGGFNDNDRYAAKSALMAGRIGCTLRAVTTTWKAEIQMAARKMVIHICPEITPMLYADLKNATYGMDGLYLKDKKHPCHWLDAFLHSLSIKKAILDIPTQHLNPQRQRVGYA